MRRRECFPDVNFIALFVVQNELTTRNKEKDMSKGIAMDVFVEKIQDELDKGYGFNFFLGSGISYQSGIMLGTEIGDYLSYVYYKIMLESSGKPGWTIRDSGWPSVPKESAKKAIILGIAKEYIEVCHWQEVTVKMETDASGELSKLYIDNKSNNNNIFESGMRFSSTLNRPICPRVIPEKVRESIEAEDEEIKKLWVSLKKNSNFVFHNIDNSVPNSDNKLIREAGLRSLYEWRATLEFLARLRVDENSKKLRLSNIVDQDVIDSFNRFMVGNRKPNQNHYLITHLSRPLRTRKLFTTNFDTLMEDAFRRDKQPIKVLSLEIGGSLPSPDLMRPGLTLLKLHGEARNTRADFSIDDVPTDTDKRTFAAYLSPDDSRRTLPSHLMVVGASLSDKRILKLIISVLDNRENFKVFILANKNYDVTYYKTLFRKHYDKKCIGRSVFISPPAKPEYTLYELYQRLTLSLPPGGFFYQFDQNLPPISGATENHSLPAIDLDYLRKSNIENLDTLSKGRGILGICGKYGVTRVSTAFFNYMQGEGLRCMWFELEDFSRPEDLISEIVRAILNEIGKFQLEHVVTGFSDLKELPTRLARHIEYTRITPENWVIFIYGRNIPGECAGFNDKIWKDNKDTSEDDKSNKEKLKDIINTLLDSKFKIVFMPFDKHRQAAMKENRKLIEDTFGIKYGASFSVIDDNKTPGKIESKVNDNVWSADDLSDIAINADNTFKLSLDKKYEEIKKIASGLQNDFSELLGVDKKDEKSASKKKFRYYYVSTLFRQSRHLSALISEASIPCELRFNTTEKDNDLKRAKTVLKLRKELVEKRIIHCKPGGYVWKYGDIRHGMREVLQNSKRIAALYELPLSTAPECKLQLNLSNYRASSHLLISDWYLKAFMATGHPTPLMEAMYHLFSSVRYCRFAKHSRYTEITSLSSSESLLNYRFTILVVSLRQINKALYLARTSIKRWMYETNNEQRFSEEAVDLALFEDFYEVERVASTLSKDDFRDLFRWVLFVLGCDKAEFARCKLKMEVIQVLIQDLFVQSAAIKLDLEIEAGNAQTESGFRNAAGITSENSFFVRPQFQSANHHTNLERFDFYRAGECHQMELGLIERLGEIHKKSECNFDQIAKIVEEYITSVYALFSAKPEDKELTHRLEVERDKLDKNVIKAKAAALIAFSLNQNYLLEMVSLVSDFAYLYVKWAKMIERVEYSIVGFDRNRKNNPRFCKSLWASVCVLCSYGLELLKLVPREAINEELALRAKYLSIYGLALGRLGRSCEAHRRLNEANGMDFNFSERVGSSISASVALRRAEVCLYEAFYHLNMSKVPVSQKYIAYLDDVYVMLKRAEFLLSGINHSSLWWGRLHMLRIRLYASYSPDFDPATSLGVLPLMYREKRDYFEFIKSCFIKGLLVSPNNAYRRLCYTHYLLYALKNIEAFHNKYKVLRTTQAIPKILNEVACISDDKCESLNEKQLVLRLLSDHNQFKQEHEFKGYAERLFDIVVNQVKEARGSDKKYD